MSWIGPGGTVAGRYVVEALAGSGGVGVVYQARERESGERVAVKVMPLHERGVRTRFEREAEALRGLSHPGIVRYVAHGLTDEGFGYLAMEWLEGEDLKQRLARGPLFVTEAIELGRRVAEALGAAHERGLIHRDIKPSNIILVGGAAFGVKVVDFGLARFEDRLGDGGKTAAARDLTRTGALLGTPAYMAPEQARGATDLDARTDVFALGGVLYECLTGAQPFAGATAFEVLGNVLATTPIPAATRRPEVGPALSALLSRMLAKHPSGRPADGASVARELAALGVQGEPRAARRHEVSVERVVAADPSLAWALLCDTNRWNRLAGSPPTRYAYEQLPGDPPGVHTRIGRADIVGVPARWLEVGEWIEGRLGWGERRFLEGLFESIRIDLDVAPAGAGSHVLMRATIVPRGEVPDGPLEMTGAHLQKRLGQLCDAVDRACQDHPEPTAAAVEPAGARAARLVLAQGSDRILSGRAAETRGADLAFRRRAFDQAPVGDDLRARLYRFVEQSPDDHLRQVRPFVLARVWALPRRELLAAFLHATRAGLFDLRWMLLCPTCRVASAVAPSLGELTGHGHCHECQIDYDLDLASNVEAVFHVSPALRDVAPEVYCAGSPAFRPHVFAVLRAEPRGEREATVAVPEGPFAVRVPGFEGGTPLAMASPAPASLLVRIAEAGVTLTPEGGASPETSIRIVNETDRAASVQIERVTPGADAVLGATMLTVPGFADLFAAEAPAAGVDLAVSTLTLLAVEVTGADALCERLGDARAVRPLLAALAEVRAAVAHHEGALLEAMGPTVLACFTTPAPALAAAHDVREHLAHLVEHGDLPELSFRAGLCEGSCLAVRSGDRLELFGRTVAAATRLLAGARPGEIAVHPALLSHPDVARALASTSAA